MPQTLDPPPTPPTTEQTPEPRSPASTATDAGVLYQTDAAGTIVAAVVPIELWRRMAPPAEKAAGAGEVPVHTVADLEERARRVRDGEVEAIPLDEAMRRLGITWDEVHAYADANPDLFDDEEGGAA